MPFTPSHAVVALPFVRTPLVSAAVAVGAMTPDLPLFLRGTFITYPGTHDLRWIVLTVVLAWVLLLVWRCVLRPAARELAPRWLAARLPGSWDDGPSQGWRESAPLSPRPLLLLVISLAVGVASHIAWDAFTHEGRVGVALFPALDQQWGPLLGFKWVQHGSSALGLLILATGRSRPTSRSPTSRTACCRRPAQCGRCSCSRCADGSRCAAHAPVHSALGTDSRGNRHRPPPCGNGCARHR
ncbi:MAG: cell wall anchor protein [Microbacterium sp.]|nr:cell wall anchor protein [Microbacterium sp.]